MTNYIELRGVKTWCISYYALRLACDLATTWFARECYEDTVTVLMAATRWSERCDIIG